MEAFWRKCGVGGSFMRRIWFKKSEVGGALIRGRRGI